MSFTNPENISKLIVHVLPSVHMKSTMCFAINLKYDICQILGRNPLIAVRRAMASALGGVGIPLNQDENAATKLPR